MNLIYYITDLIHLYPYHSRAFSLFAAVLFTIVTVLPLYGVYWLIIWKMTTRGRMLFDRILIMSGFLLVTLFFIEITLTLLTEHHVNKQLGFNYATPETPEGEFLVITKVVSGGIMDKAGLKRDDRVLMNSTIKLYRLLIRNQGGETEFNILRDNKEVTIRLKVPAMKLPLRRGVVWF
jgi:hypothetical protein